MGYYTELSEYRVWNSMIQRCCNKNNSMYYRYGARGIIVCERWKNSFENFLEDMGKKPFDKAQIDRKDNDGNYEPFNCRWVSPKENGRNKSNNLVIEWDNQKKTLSEWSEIINIKYKTLRDRIYKYGWTVEEAFTTNPLNFWEVRDSSLKNKVYQDNKNPICQYDKDMNFIRDWESLSEATTFYNLSKNCISNCLKKGINTTAGGYKWKYKLLTN